MFSRLFWIGLAGFAIIAGVVVQNGGQLLHWSGESDSTRPSIRKSVDRAVEGGMHKMEVVGPDGNEVHASPEAKRALAAAVGRLVKAKTDLAFLRAGDASDREIAAAEARSEEARAEVDRLKGAILAQERAAAADEDLARDRIRQEVRDEVRAAVRDAVGS